MFDNFTYKVNWLGECKPMSFQWNWTSYLLNHTILIWDITFEDEFTTWEVLFPDYRSSGREGTKANCVCIKWAASVLCVQYRYDEIPGSLRWLMWKRKVSFGKLMEIFLSWGLQSPKTANLCYGREWAWHSNRNKPCRLGWARLGIPVKYRKLCLHFQCLVS